MSHHSLVKVGRSLLGPEGKRLTEMLEGVMPVRFRAEAEKAAPTGGGIFVEGEELDRSSAGILSLKIPGLQTSQGRDASKEVRVRFADTSDVPFPFRGRTVAAKCATAESFLHCIGNERVLATTEQGPVWTVSSENRVRHYRSAFALPVVTAESCLDEVLNVEQLATMLPLLQFLREVCNAKAPYRAPLRACFMFDDPNLHWPRYGSVDFKQLGEHATRENYHVAFATIPLDTWFTHSRTAAIFRAYSPQLSLLVHGNNHTYKELGGPSTREQKWSLLGQALSRIARFEQATGLKASRVMAPPHGACSQAMLAELPLCGFEAATISHGSLRVSNRGEAWTKNLGYLPCENVQGCPVLPRWRLSTENTARILFAAYLSQPIILVGHHYDLRDGVEVLDHAARVINGLGQVHWGNMTELCRMNYQWQVKADVVNLRPFGRNLAVQLPPEARHLVIEEVGYPGWGKWRISGPTGTQVSSVGDLVTVPENCGGALNLELVSESAPARGGGKARPPLKAFARRFLTEGRDRVSPLTWWRAARRTRDKETPSGSHN